MKLLRFLRRARRDTEFTQEVQFYLDSETEENLARGMSLDEARAAARRKFGNTTIVREDVYRMNRVELLETLWQDCRYAWRLLLKSPGFTAVAVLTLALGIGGNTTMFTAIRAILLKPLDYRAPNQLLQVTVDYPGRPGFISFTPIRLEEMRAAPSLAELGSFLVAPLNLSLSGGAEPEAIRGARVSANFLHILGADPAVGRGFLPEEDQAGRPPVVLIGSDLWHRRFAGDPSITGKAMTLDSTPYTIVGVLPAGFQFPFVGLDVWLPNPFAVPQAPPQFWPSSPAQIGIARLKGDAGLEQARAELNGLSRRYVLAHPEMGDADPRSTVRVLRMQDQLVADVRPTLWLLFGAVGFVLLIACANIASLLLARGASRSREFAVRMAVGATRRRMIRQLLVESLMLALAGGALGVSLASWGLSSITRLSAFGLPRTGEIRLDHLVLGFTFVLSIVTTLLFGLFPSFRVSRPDLAGMLRLQGAGAAQAGERRGMLLLSARGLLVTVQVALSVVLLIGASLLIKTLARLHNVDPGFHSENLLTMHVSLPGSRYDGAKRRAFWEELQRRVEALPGVRTATVAQTLPMTTRNATQMAIAELPAVKVAERPLGNYLSVLPGYFRTLGIPLRRGREFGSNDAPGSTPMVAIIDESLARRFWPGYPAGEDPIGRHLLLGDAQQGGVEIVGVVGSVRAVGLAIDALPEIYIPMAHHPVTDADLGVRTEGDPLRLVSAVRSQVLEIDRDQPVSAVRTMEDIVDTSIGRRNLTMFLLSVFAGVAMLLAVVGIYGAIAYSVAQRTQEIAIRRALGAQESDILRLVIGQGLGLTVAGVAIGTAGALALTRFTKPLLFDTSATDPATFVSIALLFLVVASLASLIPARRAIHTDSMMGLRVG